jgi:hypothetical protein
MRKRTDDSRTREDRVYAMIRVVNELCFSAQWDHPPKEDVRMRRRNRI